MPLLPSTLISIKIMSVENADKQIDIYAYVMHTHTYVCKNTYE